LCPYWAACGGSVAHRGKGSSPQHEHDEKRTYRATFATDDRIREIVERGNMKSLMTVDDAELAFGMGMSSMYVAEPLVMCRTV